MQPPPSGGTIFSLVDACNKKTRPLLSGLCRPAGSSDYLLFLYPRAVMPSSTIAFLCAEAPAALAK